MSLHANKVNDDSKGVYVLGSKPICFAIATRGTHFVRAADAFFFFAVGPVGMCCSIHCFKATA